MKSSQFIVRIFLYALALMCVVGAINLLVDPYLLSDAPRISGFNDRKPAASMHERSMKRSDAPRRAARTLVLGSSRTGVAFNPLSDSWPTQDQPVYNLSLAGAGPTEMISILTDFIASRSGKDQAETIIIGLDFESFLYRGLPHTEATPASYDEAPVKGAVPTKTSDSITERFQTIKDISFSLFSLAALSDSVSAIIASYRGGGMTMDQRGWMEERIFYEISLANGIEGLFGQKNSETIHQYGNSNLEVLQARDGSVKGLSAVAELVSIGTGIGAEVILFVQPVHADRWEMFDRFGYWDDLEHWKRSLVELVERLELEGKDVQLWDFAGYEAPMLEMPLAQKDRSALLEWFWEPAHYKSSLGDVLIRRMRGVDDDVTDVGVQLSSANLQKRLAQVRTDRKQYRNSHPEEIERISNLLCSSAKGCKPIP